MFRNLAACVLVACLLPGVVAGEEPEPAVPLPPALEKLKAVDGQQAEILRGMLASKDARTVAWGAYEAARRRVKTLVPVLLALAADKSLDEHTGRSVRAALVDLEARAPRSLLLALMAERGFAAETAILLAVRSGADADLLALWNTLDTEGAPSDAEVAIGNALANRRAAGFAAGVLRALRFQLHLYVQDSTRRSGFRGAHGSVAGDGRIQVPGGHPPTVLHRIGTTPSTGKRVLAAGIRTIYVNRFEYTRRTIAFGSTLGSYRWQKACRDWLQMLVRRMPWHEAEVPPPSSFANVRWTTPDAFVAWAQQEHRKVAESFYELAGRLVKREVLTKQEAAALTPRIRVHVKDKRKKRESLPKLTFEPLPNPYATR